MDNDRASTFQPLDDLAIYSGFAETETLRSERDWQTSVTVLSGDIDGTDIVDASVTNVDDDDPTVYMLYIPQYYTRSCCRNR